MQILGVVLPQLQQLQRPFDKLRLLVRKLCHSAQAGVLVPTGPALEVLAQRVHRAHVAMHGYDLTRLEGQLGEALQTHSLLIWDTLHAFGQNHFGRLIHFPPSASPQQSPRAQPLPPSHAARLAAQLALSPGGGGSPGSRTSSPTCIGSPASLGSPSQHETPPQKTAAPGSVAPPNAAPYAFDPVHHDWRQIELMVRHSITCSEALPDPDTTTAAATASEEKEKVKHSRSDVAIAVMHHVLHCAEAIQTGMELGVAPCLAQVFTALKEFKDALDVLSQKFGKEEKEEETQRQEAVHDIDTRASDSNAPKVSSGYSIDEQLLSKLLLVLPTSPLLQWLSLNGGRKELTTMTGSRMGNLLDILEEIVRHNEAEGLFRSSYIHHAKDSSRGGGGGGRARADNESCAAGPSARVAVVVGNKHSEDAVKVAIESSPELNGRTIVSHWTGATTLEVQQGDGDGDKKTTKFNSGEDTHVAISLLTADEATSTKGRKFISQCDEAVWFSASDVLHAAGFDFESSALSVCCRMSAVGIANGNTTTTTLSNYLPGPECHVLATGAQTAAWLEVCRADQLLLAAMQLVQAGDASFEGYLGQMISNPSQNTWENMSVPPPAAVLHTLCLGLCGTPPQFHISKDTSNALHDGEKNNKAVYQAMAVLPEELLAPGNYALPVSFGSEEITFQGPFEESEAESRDAAAEVALRALVECGLVAAYWQTRALLVQSHKVSAADLSENVQQQCLFVSSPAPGTMPPSPFVDAAAAVRSSGNSGNDGIMNNNAFVPIDRLICPTCGIVTTSEGHLKEHLAGRRHLKNLERLQQLQQGVTTGPVRFDTAAAAAAAGQETGVVKTDLGGMNQGEPDPPTQPRRTKSGIDSGSTFSTSTSTTTTVPAEGGIQPTTLSTIDRLPSSLSDAFLRRSNSSLHRHSSGNVYEGFPCVRIGDHILPSSMDLRAFLDEMQQAGELEVPAGSGSASILGLANALGGSLLESLPSIDETNQSIGAAAAAGGGGGGGGSGSSKHLMSSISTGNPSASGGKAVARTSRVPHLNLRGSNGTSGGSGGLGGGGTPGGSSVASHDRGGYTRSGRPSPVTRSGSGYRSGSGGNQYRGGGHHQQQYQQQQRAWNHTFVDAGNVVFNQQQRQRYPSRFAQDAADLSSGDGDGAHIYGEGGGSFPAGVMAYQTAPMAYPHHPHAVHHGHGQHIIQQPIAFIPASLNMTGYHPTAVASPAGMASVGMMAVPGGNMTTGLPGATTATTFVAMPAASEMQAGAMMHHGVSGEYFPPQPPPHYHQYVPPPPPPQHGYSLNAYQQQQQNAQYYSVRSPSQQQQQQRGGKTPWRQQQQQQ